MGKFDTTIHEIFMKVHDAKTREQKIAVLHEYYHPHIWEILRHTFDPRIKWLLPEGAPPYTPISKSADVPNLMYDARRLYLFVEGPTSAQQNLKQNRREEIFIQILEGVDYRDAALLAQMKEKKLDYDGLDESLVREAFVELTADWPVPVEEKQEEKKPAKVAMKRVATPKGGKKKLKPRAKKAAKKK